MAQLTSLFLAPQDPFVAVPLSGITRVLRELRIIDAALDDCTFTAGDGFSRHVVYAGCSPFLQMQPAADGDMQFCHVALHGPLASPRLVTGPNTVKPRCPACRTRLPDWQAQLREWLETDSTPPCSGCGRRWSPHRLDWRGHAISGRSLIELRNVFPGEASPSDLLLERLQHASGQSWRYAWAGYLMPCGTASPARDPSA